MKRIQSILNFLNYSSAFLCKALLGVTLGYLLSNCSDDGEDRGLMSNYIVLNKFGNQANVSLYNSANQSFIEQFYTVESPNSSTSFKGANKNGDFLYFTVGPFFTGGGNFHFQLRKIDTTAGTMEKSVNVWTYFETYINFYNNKVVVSHMADDGYCIKIYDENLILLDSITRTNIVQLEEVTINNNRLFSVVGDGNKGYIHVMDLNTLTPLDSIEILSNVYELIPYHQDQLLCIKNSEYFILNTESLEIEDSKVVSIGHYGAALNSSEDILYYLIPQAQPSLYEFILGKVKISTGETSFVTEFDEPINDPIIFDNKGRVIVSGGGLKIFARDGEVVDLVEEALFNTSMIFVQ